MFKARLVRLRYYSLVGVFLVYVRSEDSQQTISGRPTVLNEVYASREFMRYCDTVWPINDVDEFCSRIVAINKRNSVFDGYTVGSQVVAPGVYINRNHVLTSYTPFRRLASNEKDRNLAEFYITHYKAKWLNEDRTLKGYLLETVNVTCGRQIFPNSSTDFEQGEKFLHLPSYDLMVFKTEGMRDFINESSAHFLLDSVNLRGYWIIGPQLTKLVSDKARIGNTLKYVSLGMIDYDHIYNRNHLHTVKLDTNDRLVEDCDEWFDEANSFICIRNIENHIAIGSGAFLFSGKAVIGVGCFTILKGKESVHVFTDVRKVLELIFTTCTEFDGFPDVLNLDVETSSTLVVETTTLES